MKKFGKQMKLINMEEKFEHFKNNIMLQTQEIRWQENAKVTADSVGKIILP